MKSRNFFKWVITVIILDENMDDVEKACTSVLKTVFGYDTFRPLQLDIIKSVLKGKDTLAIMPTGGGKSICYQIPALLFSGITIVVSPLISLMQDQVTSLSENGVDCAFLNSTLDYDAYIHTVQRIKKGKIKLLYISPESLSTERVRSILCETECGISCLTIDEAHCISSWGHDFRPNYLELRNLREQFPKAVCLALTATATVHVRTDIATQLSMKNPNVFVASFNRSNIFLEVRPKKNPIVQVTDFLLSRKDESGIIYCLSRKQVDKLTEELKIRGFSVLKYHAGLSDQERAKNQEFFIKDNVRIIVATVAFGMGINKPNVRFVIHYDLPKSIEEYYQEIGRAGRDGIESNALLLYSAADIHKIRFFFKDSSDSEKDEKLLKQMISYATERKCRRKMILNYFGENYVISETKTSDTCCDYCSRGEAVNNDVTTEAQKFMSCIYRLHERFGTFYVIDVLMGSKQQRILDNGHDSLSTWGIGKELEKEDWLEVASALEEYGYIEKYGDYNVLKILPKGKDALISRKPINLPVTLKKIKVLNQAYPIKRKSLTAVKKANFIKTLGEKDHALYLKIREWRKKEADEMNIAPYQIFGDKTLEELVEKKPKNETELLEVFGIGSVKAEKLGSQILRLLHG